MVLGLGVPGGVNLVTGSVLWGLGQHRLNRARRYRLQLPPDREDPPRAKAASGLGLHYRHRF
jgi:hypothetical protein